MKLSADIRQTGNSCLIISPTIILNSLTGLTSNELINIFLRKEDHLFSDYAIDKGIINNLSAECSFIYLYYSVVNKTNGQLQFNNEYIANSFQELALIYGISMERIDVNGDFDRIDGILKNEKAFLSLSYFIRNIGWHAVPIGYDNGYYAVNAISGTYRDFGPNLDNVNTIDDIESIGDGILFTMLGK
jgi:hypothetical protein